MTLSFNINRKRSKAEEKVKLLLLLQQVLPKGAQSRRMTQREGRKNTRKATGEKVHFAAVRNESLCFSSETEAKNGGALSQYS